MISIPQRAPWHRPLRSLAALTFVFATCLLGIFDAAALPAPDPKQASLFEEARQKVLAKDYDGAVVQLREVLRDDQENLPARILLGQCYLHAGRASAAETELRIALSRGADKHEVLAPLANALLMQRKYKDILEITEDSAGNHLDAEVVRARAHYELGELEEAAHDYGLAHEQAPKRLEPLLGLAAVAEAQGRTQDAESYLHQAIDIAPADPEPWFQRGNLLRAAGDFANALTSLSRALELNPNHMRARLARGNVYVAQGDYAKGKADAAYLHDKLPRDPESALLLWQTNVLTGDEAGAKAAGEDAFGILKTVKDEQLEKQPALLRSAALVSLARREYALAGRYLRKFVDLKPNDLYMRKLYGKVQLNLGDTQGAASTFRELSKIMPGDTEVLAELGRCYLMLRQYAEAASALEKAARLAPDDKALGAPLALSKIGMGSTDAAMADLAASEQKDLSTPESGGLYALLQLKRGDTKGAAATLGGLLEKYPHDAFLLNLSGSVQLKAGNLKEARKNFEDLLKRDPRYLPAAYNLAQLDFRESGPAPATARLEAIVKTDSKFVPAMELLADIAIYQGRLADALQWLEKAKAVQALDPATARKLIDLYVALDRNNDAFLAARAYADASPNSPAAAMLLARVQAATGDARNAKDSYRKAARIAITDGDALLDIAREQLALEDIEGARRSLALAAAAGRQDAAQPALIRIEIATRNFSEAERRIKLLEEDKAAPALVQLMRGEMLRKSGELREAIAAFESSLKQTPSTDAVLGLYDALMADGQRKEAFSQLEAWTARHPDDLMAGRTLAVGHVYVGNLDKARTLHETLLKKIPDDSLLLANLARIYQLQKRPEARATAERALKLEPQSAMALDTLGWILATEGELEGGLKYLRDAIARDAAPLTRFHIAAVLHELKRDDEAKLELSRIMSEAQGPLHADAQKLYDTIAARDRETTSPH